VAREGLEPPPLDCGVLLRHLVALVVPELQMLAPVVVGQAPRMAMVVLAALVQPLLVEVVVGLVVLAVTLMAIVALVVAVVGYSKEALQMLRLLMVAAAGHHLREKMGRV
jgi:hypothetical protein